MKKLREVIAASAREWGVPPRLASGIFWLPVVGALLVLVTRLDKDLYRFLLTDDGPVEWAQFACFLLALVASVLVSADRFRRGHLGQGSLFAILALGQVFSDIRHRKDGEEQDSTFSLNPKVGTRKVGAYLTIRW